MIGATLFSGIGAPECAMPRWRWAWSAEIERFPAAILAVRHPTTINLGDVTADDFVDRAGAIARPDVIVFGSPCQDWSVAGKRLGLDGARGNLALVALGIIDRLRPRWFVFENVPGLMSAWSGGPACPPEPGCQIEGDENSDFAAFLGAVDELRYSLCWARLDAQHFGVAQRRERVFAVGHLGDWRYPAAVLLEPESLCGDPPSREQARQGIAGAIGAGSARSGGRVGRREAAANHLIGFNNTGQGWWNDSDVATGLRDASNGGAKEATLVTHSLRAEGFDASEDGTERGIPLVAATLESTASRSRGAGTPIGMLAYGGNDTRGPIDVATAVNAHGGPHGRLDFESETFIAFDTTQITSKTNRCQPRDGDPCHPLAAGAHAPTVAYRTSGTEGAYETGDRVDALTTGTDPNSHGVMVCTGVRRLMPVECERLQGFPDDYTLIAFRGKPAADGPRYKSLGNSMAVPVMRWILTRIEHVDRISRGAP